MGWRLFRSRYHPLHRHNELGSYGESRLLRSIDVAGPRARDDGGDHGGCLVSCRRRMAARPSAVTPWKCRCSSCFRGGSTAGGRAGAQPPRRALRGSLPCSAWPDLPSDQAPPGSTPSGSAVCHSRLTEWQDGPGLGRPSWTPPGRLPARTGPEWTGPLCLDGLRFSTDQKTGVRVPLSAPRL